MSVFLPWLAAGGTRHLQGVRVLSPLNQTISLPCQPLQGLVQGIFHPFSICSPLPSSLKSAGYTSVVWRGQEAESQNRKSVREDQGRGKQKRIPGHSSTAKIMLLSLVPAERIGSEHQSSWDFISERMKKFTYRSFPSQESHPKGPLSSPLVLPHALQLILAPVVVLGSVSVLLWSCTGMCITTPSHTQEKAAWSSE